VSAFSVAISVAVLNKLAMVAAAADYEIEECDSAAQPVPPNSVQNLKFKTHFFEVIEELRMRRVSRTSSSAYIPETTRAAILRGWVNLRLCF